MKSRYNFLSFLLLFCASLMAQSQPDVRVISPVNLRDNHVVVIKDDYALINNTNSKVVVHHRQNHRNPCKVFIGVGTTRHAETNGLKVDYTVENTPATTYGVQEGDIILALDGVPVTTQTELEAERDKHEQGEAFTLDILRNGEKMTVDARFKSCTEEELKEAEQEVEVWEEMMNNRMIEIQTRVAENLHGLEMKERPILGIYKDEEAGTTEGLVIKEIIAGKGAESAGLKTGDLIKFVDGKSIAGDGGLYAALIPHKPGDKVSVIYVRDGQTVKTEVTLSGDNSSMRLLREAERNPCKVFIGVYTTDFSSEGAGVRVSGVIDNTPAKESAVQPGDIILALDDQPVTSNTQLRIERDKHNPGDQFTLTILREGVRMDIGAIFKECPKEKDATLTVPAGQDLIPAEERENLQAPPTDALDFVLQLESFEAFPSPTLGPVNIRFEAKAVPTTVRITDVHGKTVYENRLNQFGGSFNEQLNLEGKSPGIYTITVQQENKVFSKKIVLLSRV